MRVTNSKRKKASSRLWNAILIFCVVLVVSVGFNYAYKFLGGISPFVFDATFISCMIAVLNFFRVILADGEKSSRGRRIPNEDNHFAPGYLDPGAINSSEVDPGNPSMDPFDPFDD